MEKWFVINKGADFAGIAKRFGISPVTARLIRNRGVMGDEAIARYLKGGIGELYDPHLLLDSDRLTDILVQKISEQKKIRVIGDYDIDGVMSTYILYKGITRCGGSVDFQIPDRMKDGYGINDHLIEQADEAGIDTIITCDNGIAASAEIADAKERGLTVVITDHHDIPFQETENGKEWIIPPADAVINPKQADCAYPNKNLCGAVVAWKLIWALYEKNGISQSEVLDFTELTAVATVGDVMDLQGENRVLVKLGLKMLNQTQNIGMKALILQSNRKLGEIRSGDIGFGLGPCLNATGRLETARIALKLLLCESEAEAAVLAQEAVDLNNSRKLLTEQAVEVAKQMIADGGYENDRVFVIFLPDCHESLAGIVAGRIREAYHRPTLVITRGEEGAKGSGRSIEGYSMFEELNKCADLLSSFGGHPMAAGFSLPEENIEAFRRRLNEVCTLTEEELQAKVVIDVPMPIGYITFPLIEQLKLLEPFGKGNDKPVFADRNLVIERLKIYGPTGRVVQLTLHSSSGAKVQAVYFGDPDNLRLPLEEKYGKVVADDTMANRCVHNAALHFTYYPEIDTYYETPRVKLKITGISA